jgi:hypothetical protein
LVIAGSALTIFSVTKGGGPTLYYLGVIVIFAGAWLNASLLYYVRKWTTDHRRQTTDDRPQTIDKSP